jgi:hypothetical protein
MSIKYKKKTEDEGKENIETLLIESLEGEFSDTKQMQAYKQYEKMKGSGEWPTKKWALTAMFEDRKLFQIFLVVCMIAFLLLISYASVNGV